MEQKLDFAELGYEIPAAPPGAWRDYDVNDPQPPYFVFDWIGARYPDLYDAAALSSVSLVKELPKVVDLGGLVVADIGAGTARSAIGLAKQARHVYAFDNYASVADFGRNAVQAAGIKNVEYQRANWSALPLPDDSVDAVTVVWAYADPREVRRVLKPGGWLVVMEAPPGASAGELAATIKATYPTAVPEGGVLPAALFDPACPPSDTEGGHVEWAASLGVDFRVHDFTSTVDFGSVDESAAILGRFYGPPAAEYMRSRHQSTFTLRLRIYYGRLTK